MRTQAGDLCYAILVSGWRRLEPVPYAHCSESGVRSLTLAVLKEILVVSSVFRNRERERPDPVGVERNREPVLDGRDFSQPLTLAVP